jgi:predicted Zn-ribbon and HTH transcriptional regulator
MEAKVYDFEDERDKRSPHTTGRVRCQSCGYEWQAVWLTSIDVSVLECPDCHAQWSELAGEKSS